MNGVRRLAAILAADVVGYSRMMGADEEGTLARLRSLRRRLVDPKIDEHRGRIVKTMGDGLLVEFQSVVDALRCADEVQRAMAEAYASFPPDRRLVFRIGIHQGDVVFQEDGDIFGDGVNIAARLEGIAEPGGICVSNRVQEDAVGKLGLTFEDMGEQSLKNISRPVRTYRVRPAGSRPGVSDRTVVRPIGGGAMGGGPIGGGPIGGGPMGGGPMGGGAGAGVGRPAAPSPGDGGAGAARELKPGTVLGHTYRIEALLGRGGMGEVYRATHIELGTTHAIKLILPALASDPKVVQLLIDEARKLGQVRHDAIVNYEGLFRDEQGLRYLVTEFVEGSSLKTVLAGRRLEPDEVLQLRDRLAEGLAAVHTRGIIHRDISPDNIILPGGEVGRAKLIDFGFATTGERGDSTLVGVNLAARHAFASPEQLGLFGGRVDSRSDIYSLGLVLAAAALGFGRTLEMGATPGAAIAARQKQPDLGGLPAPLRPAIAPMLEPLPADRPGSARALVERAPAWNAAAAAARGRGLPSGRSVWLVGASVAAAIVVAGLVGGAVLLLRGNPASAPVSEELRGRLAAATAGYACAAVSQTLAPDRSVRLTGHVATSADLDRLRRDIAAVPGIGSIDFAVQLMGRPQCDVVALLTPLSEIATREGASLAFASKNREAYIGERPALDLRVPGFDSYIYVDYFDSGGQVQHLFPNDRDRFNLRPWRNHFVLFKSQLWTVCGNIGRQLITMVAVSKSIFPLRRPEIEDAHDYLVSLGDAVKRIPQGKSAASLLFFDLREAPPWISREQACPGG